MFFTDLLPHSSVGYNLIRDGLVFGGKILTATDIVSASAVASGDLSETKRIGDLAKVARIASDAALLAGAQASIKKKLEALVSDSCVGSVTVE